MLTLAILYTGFLAGKLSWGETPSHDTGQGSHRYLQSLGAGRAITFFHTPRRGILKPVVRSCWGGGFVASFPFCLRTLQLWGHQRITLSQQDGAIYTRCCQGNRFQQLYVSLGLVRLTCKLLFIKKQPLRNAKKKKIIIINDESLIVFPRSPNWRGSQARQTHRFCNNLE